MDITKFKKILMDFNNIKFNAEHIEFARAEVYAKHRDEEDLELATYYAIAYIIAFNGSISCFSHRGIEFQSELCCYIGEWYSNMLSKCCYVDLVACNKEEDLKFIKIPQVVKDIFKDGTIDANYFHYMVCTYKLSDETICLMYAYSMRYIKLV